MVTVWQRGIAAELSWLSAEGPVGIPVVPLVWRSMPCVALPFAHLDAVDTLTSGSGVAAFSVTDGATLAPTTPAMAATGPVEITYDTEGRIFTERLIDDETVKHPPTRLRAGNLIGRRDNWWWVGRILISLARIDDKRELPKRTRPADAVLVRDARPSPATTHSGRAPRDSAHVPRVDVVTAEDWPQSGAEVRLWSRDGRPLEGGSIPVFAFGHAHSPDFERWERWYRLGELAGDSLYVLDGEGAPAGELEPFGMLARLRNHREVERACRAGIAAAERRGLGC